VPGSREFVFEVPAGRYQLLRFRAQLFAISGSVPLSRDGPIYPKPFPGDHDLYGLWSVDDYSWLHALVYGRRRWVAFRYELAAAPAKASLSPVLRATARFLRPTWSEAAPVGRLQKAFAEPQPSDVSEPFADAELALEPVAAATPKERKSLSCA